MAAYSFPPSPVEGQTYPNPPVVGQYVYRYSATSNTWTILGVAGAAAAGVYGDSVTSVTITIDAAGVIQNIINAPIRLSNNGAPGLAAPGTGLRVNSAGTIDLLPPSGLTIGGVRPGNNLSSDVSGVLTVKPPTDAVIGAVRAGSNVAIDSSGVLTVKIATPSSSGAIIPGNNLSVSGTGVLTVLPPAGAVIGAVTAGATMTISPTGVIDVLPPTGTNIGGVRAGNNVNITGTGILTVRTATPTIPGVVAPSNGFNVSPTGVLTLAPATTATLGGIIVGENLDIAVDGTLTLKPPTNTVIGGVRAGTNINITSDGVISSTNPGGSVTSISGGTGIITSPNPITTSGTVSLGIATSSVLGGVRPDGVSILVDASGVISAAAGSTAYWQLTSGNLRPITNGQGVNIYNASGSNTVFLNSLGQITVSNGNTGFNISPDGPSNTTTLTSQGIGTDASLLYLNANSHRLRAYGSVFAGTFSTLSLSQTSFTVNSSSNANAFSLSPVSGNLSISGDATFLSGGSNRLSVTSSVGSGVNITSQATLGGGPAGVFLNASSLTLAASESSPLALQLTPGIQASFNNSSGAPVFSSDLITGITQTSRNNNIFQVTPSDVDTDVELRSIDSSAGSDPQGLKIYGESVVIAGFGGDYANTPGSLTLSQTQATFSVPVNNLALSGIPTAPTALPGTDSTQLATTAFVQQGLASSGTLTRLDQGDGITLSPAPITTIGTISLTPASGSTLGGIIAGDGLSINSVTGLTTLTPAGTGVLGGVIGGGQGISFTPTGVISVAPATAATLGGIIPGSTLIISPLGVLDVSPDNSLWEYDDTGGYLQPTNPLNGVFVPFVRINDGLNPEIALESSALVYDGVGSFRTRVVSVAATAERTVSIPDKSGTVILSTDLASTSSLGVVKVDGTSITVAGDGTISTPITFVSKFSASVPLNFGTIPANSSAELPIAVPGALPTDVCVASPNLPLAAGFTWCAYCSANDIVTVRVTNCTTSAADPDTGLTVTWRASASRP